MGRASESTLLETLFPSAMPNRWARQIIPFPEQPAGKTILDIGAGQSALTAWLRTQGANAYALDPRYADISAMDEAMRKSVPSMRKKFKQAGAKDRWEPYEQDLEQTRAEWRTDITNNPSNYIAGYATALPFPDKSVDFLFSINCIAQGLDREEQIFIDAIKEVLRVLKPGGEAYIHPLFWTNDKKITALHKELVNGGYVEAQHVAGNYRARIRKPTFVQ